MWASYRSANVKNLANIFEIHDFSAVYFYL